MNMIYHVGTFCGRVFDKSQTLQGDRYICKVPNPLNIYVTNLFLDHHQNKPPH